MTGSVRPAMSRLSPAFLAIFLGCSASTAWTLEHRRGVREAAVSAVDPQAELIQCKGYEHEAYCTAALSRDHRPPVQIPSGSLVSGMAETDRAMNEGARLIMQAALADRNWVGYAAFLLSRNRFNVTISRARCLAVLIASPGVRDFVACSVDEMRLANVFCWA